MTHARVVLQPRRARPFYGHHPWVYAGAVAAVEGEPADGDVVDLFSHAGDFVARGLYNGKSKIRVRLYTWQPDTPPAQQVPQVTTWIHRHGMNVWPASCFAPIWPLAQPTPALTLS